MPPRINLLAASRSLACRPKAANSLWLRESRHQIQPALHRGFADSKDLPKAPAGSKGLNEDQLPNVNEEATKTKQIMGCGGGAPEQQQGSTVDEIVKGDKEAIEKLPKVMRDSINAAKKNGTRSFSTSARQAMDLGVVESPIEQPPPQIPGLKFSMPPIPLPRYSHLKVRYDPMVHQFTNLLMRHGRKSVAQRNMAVILEHLRTSSPPKTNPARPLIPGAPPASHLPLNPVLYLTLAVDSVAPLLRMKSMRGAAGGGVALQIPRPLGKRQRRRSSIQWILTAASKRKNRGSGKNSFAQRVAEEIVSVVEGRSSVWERRNMIHKQGVSARANLNWAPKK